MWIMGALIDHLAEVVAWVAVIAGTFFAFRWLAQIARESATAAPKKTRIFVYCGGFRGGLYIIQALTEHGRIVAGELVSHLSDAKPSMGFGTDRHKDSYNRECPEGWELEWADSIEHPGLREALDRYGRDLELNPLPQMQPFPKD